MNFTERLYDPLHGFIHLTPAEKKLLDLLPFTRLHYLHQLGITYLVYPGATHSRYEHSLGVMHLATHLYDRLFFAENPIYKQALRIGALSHDLGHLPFSHAAENLLLGQKGHEFKTYEMLHSEYLEPYFASLETHVPGFRKLVLKIALSPSVFAHYYPDEEYSDMERMLSEIVSGDYFGVDRIDYLLRDSRCTGVSHGLFDYPQLLEMLEVSSDGGRARIVLKEEGLAAAEGLLLARHYMHNRVYRHPGVLVYNRALAEFMDQAFPEGFATLAPKEYLAQTDADVTSSFLKASLDPLALGHKPALILTKKIPRKDLELPGDNRLKERDLRPVLFIKKRDGQVISIRPRASSMRLFEDYHPSETSPVSPIFE